MLSSKKAEQASAREEIKKERAQGFDTGGQEGQTGGPASTV
jgi:hypothetical protein